MKSLLLALTLADAIAKQAYPITVAHGALAGKGADVLKTAIDDATFVMLGEDHGIEQIPSFDSAVCAELAPHGFHRLALEVGPSVADTLATDAAAPARDGARQLKAFDARYPESIAFYTWREDFGFVASCARSIAAHKQSLEIWGVDQELMGASQLLFDRILATTPGDDAAHAIETLAAAARDARAAAAKTNDFGKLFMISVEQTPLDAAAALLASQGSKAAQQLFASLLASRAIYQGQMSASPYASNLARAQLMKDQFFGALSAAAGKDKAMPKVIVKLGAWHLYRGLNPLRSSDLGNLIAEAAAAHDVHAVNVLILGVTGKQLTATGPGAYKPSALDLRDKDSAYSFLGDFYAAQAPHAWTLFDLRALRGDFDSFGPTVANDKELERTIFGYDFLVLIADPRPEHPL
jgi:hypothetical protein